MEIYHGVPLSQYVIAQQALRAQPEKRAIPRSAHPVTVIGLPDYILHTSRKGPMRQRMLFNIPRNFECPWGGVDWAVGIPGSL